MKKMIFTILLLIISINIFAKTGVEKEVEKIKKEFVKINSEKDYEIKTVNEPKNGIGTEYYLKNGKLKKIVNHLPIANGDSITEYYLDNNKVFFVYRMLEFYEMREYGVVDLEHLKKIEERYYFDSKNNLIRYTEDDKTYDKGKIPQKYIEEAGNTLDEFLRLKDELN
jgi:outer membrane protein P13